MSGLEPEDVCTICSCEFDADSEGGLQGYLGILPVSFCPTCLSGLMDMADQINGVSEDGPEED